MKNLRTVDKENINIHITYDEAIKLKDFSYILNVLNMSINDYYRENGVKSNALSEYAAVVNKVDAGSIWLELGVAFFGQAIPAIVQCMMQRFQKDSERREKNLNMNASIKLGNKGEINIHVDYHDKW
ncbi:MAG: hypothetical protein IKV00_00715 [Clostridia bacterium]|nr:hypothetical protein [Clostridia bacterium]